MRLLNGVIIIAVCVSASVLAGAQSTAAPQDTVIRAESRQVIVDTIALDKKGEYVRDLGANDFHIFEDGKEQKIESVIYETSGAAGASAPQYVVVFFDYLPLEYQVHAREAAMQFIQANAGPARPIALMNFEFNGNIRLVQNFTAEVDPLRKAAQQLRLFASPAVAASVKDNAEATFLPGPSVTASLPNTANPANSPTLRPGIQGRNDGSDLVTFSSAPNAANSAPDPVGRNLMVELQDAAKALATVPGRKAILWLNSSFRLATDNEDVFKSLIAACNKANVTLYPVNVGGKFSSNEPLNILAKETGGALATNPNDILGGLQRAVSDERERYLIAYTPPKTAEKSCHVLRVKVDRPDTNLRARSQYCNIPPMDPLAGTDIDKVLAERAASSQAGTIYVSAQVPYFYIAANKARVHLVAEVSPAELNFASRNGRFRSALYVLGIAYNQDGTTAAHFTDEVDFDFATKKDADQFKGTPYRYSNQFEILSGTYKLQLVFSAEEKSFGKVEVPLTIDAFDGKQLSISSLAISKEFRAASASQGVDAILAANRRPLVSKGVQFTPAVRPRIKKTDRAAFYFEVYDPLLAGTDSLKVAVRFRITERDTGQSKVESNMVDLEQYISAHNSVVPVALMLPVDQLTPGAFRLEVQAGDSAGKTSQVRTQDFEVE